MRKYNLFPYEDGDCVCSCLQSILDRNGRPTPSQEEIAKRFPRLNRGLSINEESLDRFLENHDLHVSYKDPFGIVQPDIILRDVSEELDVMVAYSFNNLHSGADPIGHTSLLAQFRPNQERELLLFEWGFPDCFLQGFSLPDLMNSMRNTPNSGFYLIDD